MRILSIVYEPADYTLGLIRNIYIPKSIDWCFLYSKSKASIDHGELTSRPVLSEMSLVRRVRFFLKALKNYDVFVLNGWTKRINVEFYILNLLLYRKPVGWESDTELSVPMNPLKRFLKFLWLGIVFRPSFCYGLAGGTCGHKALFRYYGMAERRIVLAPMMIDNALYYRKEAMDVGWVDGLRPFRYVYLGRLTVVKQVGKIIDAFIEAHFDGAELHIIGTGEDEKALKEKSVGFQNIIFHGSVFGDEKIKLLHAMDCLILYSIFEPWGLVVNEAMCSGLPCIVSNRVGAHHDLIEGKNSGIIVPFDDIKALTDAMKKMPLDLTRYKTMSRYAVECMSNWDYHRYDENFSNWLKLIK